MKSKPNKTLVLAVANILVFVFSFCMFLVLRYHFSPGDYFQSALKYLKIRILYAQKKPLCPNCNVILVSLDTLSANHLPCYGYPRNTAPNLCKFAGEHISFRNMYANSYYTLPSHVSIFTGLYVNNHNVYHAFQHSLKPQIPFLPEIMQKNGYYTHFGMITSDQHLPVDKVYNRGINDIFDPSMNDTLWQKDLELFQKKISQHQKTFMFLHTYTVHSPYWIAGKEKYTDKKFANIPTTFKEFNTCSPAFIQYAQAAIQDNLDREQWFDKTETYKQLLDDLKDGNKAAAECRSEKNIALLSGIRQNYFFSKQNINTPEEIQYISDLYDQKIFELDAQLTALFKMMEKPGIKDNTILIITADHGEEFMEHNEIQHITLYDSNVKIPLFVSVPGAGKKSVQTLTESVDIVPTILQLVGIRGDFKFKGVSAVPGFFGDQNGKQYAVAEHMDLNLKTIRDDTYKLFLKERLGKMIPYELYNTQKDPGEHNNILFSNYERAALLQKKLTGVLK